jgi:hypothetical protein
MNSREGWWSEGIYGTMTGRNMEYGVVDPLLVTAELI